LCDTESISRWTLSCMASFMHFFPVKLGAHPNNHSCELQLTSFHVIGYGRSRSDNIKNK